MSSTTAGAKFGRRLLPHVIDDLALTRTDEECFSIPRTSNPEDGWKPITFKAYATAIDFLSHEIIEKCGYPESNTFPTLAYIGPNDARYVVFCIAAIKTGYKALFISPRNSHEAQMSLFEATDCRIVSFPDSHRTVVDPWLQEREMLTMVVASLEDCFAIRDVPHFPYDKTFEDAECTPAIVLHTSGSTGLPKPFIAMHGLLTAFDAYHDFPEWNGCRTFTQVWSEGLKRLFTPFPLFHAGGIYLFMSRVIYWGNTVAFGMADRPLSPDLAVECLKSLDVESALLPPVILEYMSQSPVGIQALSRLKMVFFGGGELATYAGDELVKHGVTLVNSIAATEFSPFTNYVIKKPELWQYFMIKSDTIGIDWRLLDGYDDVYRLIFARQSPQPGLQTCFYALPDEQELDTKDLFKPHPTLPDHWLYYGRSDNIIVLSNGEKLNPASIESLIERHPLVKGALVVGSGRFQIALLIEPAKPLVDGQETTELIEAVWPTVVCANEETVAHGRLAKEFIMISDPKKPLPRGGKGTIQRANAIKLYQEQIDQLYANVGKAESGTATYQLDVGSELAFTECIRKAFETSLRSRSKIELDTDLYTAGIDSLQVINVCRQLKSGLAVAGLHDVAAVVTIATIYKQRTPRHLGSHLYSLINQRVNDNPVQNQKHESKTMELMWRKYTESLPQPKPNRHTAVTEGQNVILTGSTGMLGSYMLAQLLSDPHVAHVHCLNRARDGGVEQQEKSMMLRGLPVNFSKCIFHAADMSQEDFGLGHGTYDSLLREVDRIFLVAWPVNFNLPFDSYEPHIRGVRNVANFASTASKRVEVTFISSIDTCSGWDAAQGPVPEARLEDLSLPSTGYGRSKLVASLVLEDAAKAGDFPATVIRVGQIAGSESETHLGVWNRHEWIPSIIASSLYLKALPKNLGQKNMINWMPIERMVGLIFDVAGAGGYFHGVNPETTTWTELVPAIQEFYGTDRLPDVVSFQDWVALLEASLDNASSALDKNPSLKLLDLNREVSTNSRTPDKGTIGFSTAKTAEKSQSLRTATAVTSQLMVHWCRKWGF
ncbi:nonribosomal peptide synthetase [Nemania abortiva]|nr:nonribosomal peptide synthetase [Nemania abortiva]